MTVQQDNRTQENKIRLRVAISDGYALVKSMALTESLAQATPEQLMVELLDELTGSAANPRRISRLDKVRQTRAQLQAAIEQIRTTPPEQLAMSSASDSSDSALTEETPDAT